MNILYEIHKCESYNELKYSNGNMAFQDNCKKSILESHKVSESKYFKTMDYYKKNYTELELMYDSLIVAHEVGRIK